VTVPRPDALPRRAIIGSVEVTEIVTESDSPWFGGKAGLALRDPVPCEPIPAAGALGYFEWHHDGTLAEPMPWMRAGAAPMREGGLFDDLPVQFEARRKSPSAGPEGPGNAGVDRTGDPVPSNETARGRHDSQPSLCRRDSVLFMFAATQVAAHTGEGINTGFASGFWHPILGWDHVVAMVAVGLWGAFLGAPAIWILPVVFPLVMALGGALGVAGVPIPRSRRGSRCRAWSSAF
jgi:hypothetical protein